MKNSKIVNLFIRLAVLSLLIIWAFSIIKPFIGVLAWAIILAVAIFPFYQKLVGKGEGKNKKLITAVFTLITVVAISVPTYSVFSSVLSSTTETIQKFRNDTIEIAPPTEKVKDWPMGDKIYENWNDASQNVRQYVLVHKDFILEHGKGTLGSILGIMGSLILFIISFIIAVIFMFNGDKGYTTSVKFANKMIGNEGEGMVIMARNTIRSVVKGILFVAIIQALLSFIGFKLIGLPGAGIFTMIVLFAAIVQLPVTIVVIPAIALAFSVSDNTTYTVIFTVYIVIVSLLDNVLKPLLLAKGLQTPTVIIFIGAIGGVMLQGIIGLFVGTVVLALMHQLYLRWVNSIEED